MLEEELYAELKKKTNLPDETLHSCINALALVMSRELAQQQFFDMPDVGRLVLGAPKTDGDDDRPQPPVGPAPTRPQTKQADSTTSRVRLPSSFDKDIQRLIETLRLPPTGIVEGKDEATPIGTFTTVKDQVLEILHASRKLSLEDLGLTTPKRSFGKLDKPDEIEKLDKINLGDLEDV
ncbi:MAG TPA: hypothetical protein VIM60_06170 [Edaphobacter sp.]